MTATRRKPSTGEQAPPADQALVEPGQPEPPAPEQPASTPVSEGPTPTQAAPIDPPPAPKPPAADPGPAPQIRMLATPGGEFVDLVWGDSPAGQQPEKADPNELFYDPGGQFSYVVVARPLVRLFYLPGTTTVAEQLYKGKGTPLDRGHADKIRLDLEAVRASQE
ncbi:MULTISPECIES: hypothetical protein [Nonomuraea]|uniref:Uncharacterized protein n=1 Tax=Nonomuraea africana TaxID=46171 RepID=A0ABR9KYB2_9ACTN|nr:hypothetical protein [Nonomuraea africana]MBE1566593.1 hypothetical protein [Nonomuraea africana]